MILTDLIIFGIGFFAAFVGSIAAGSGLILISALLFLGIPLPVALGSTKVGALGSRIGNIIRFLKHQNMGVPWRDIVVLTLIGIPGALLGTFVIVSIESQILEKIIGVILVLLLPFLFREKVLGIVANRASGIKRFFSHIGFFLLSIWDGFFSPGASFFQTYLLAKGYGYTLLQGKAVTRIPYFIADAVSISIFVVYALIDYRIAIVLFVGMLLGGYVGTAVAIKKGDAWIKPLLGIVIVVTAIKLIFF